MLPNVPRDACENVYFYIVSFIGVSNVNENDNESKWSYMMDR